MGGYPTGPEECAPPECEPRITSLGDPGPIAVFVFWGLVLAYLTLYLLVKVLRSRSHYIPPTRLELATDRPSKSEQDTNSTEQVILVLKPTTETIAISFDNWLLFWRKLHNP